MNLVNIGERFSLTRILALLALIIPAVALTLAEDQSPRNKSDEADSFDVEPPVLKQNLSNDRRSSYLRALLNSSFAHWQKFSSAGLSLPLREIIPIGTRFGSGMRRRNFTRLPKA